jgi:quinol-cytochrome oxidoreductase complex cytochrome b subunit
MFGAIALLFALPWIDRGKVKSIRYRGTGYKVALGCSCWPSWAGCMSAPVSPPS